MVGEEIVAILNEILRDLEGDDYAEALAALEGVDSLEEAVEDWGSSTG